MISGVCVELRLLGPVEARLGDRVIDLGPRHQRFVLAVLAWEVNRLVPVDRLVEWLWPEEPPRSAAHAVRVYVSNLRTRLADAGVEAVDATIATQGPGYLLRMDPMRIDVHRFQRQIDQARVTSGDRRKVLLLQQALELWTGPALADVATEQVRERFCGGLAQTRLGALEDRFDCLLRLGRHQQILGELTTLVDAEPTRERLVGQLMLALHRSAQTGKALDTARRTRSYLAEELGIDPGAELQQLELAILRDDPALAAGQPTSEPLLVSAVPAPRTRLIGRDHDVTDVVDRLGGDGPRLLTLTGPGGVGKTRLAVAAASALVPRFGDGVAIVSLAPLTDPALVLPTIAGSLRIQDMGAVPLPQALADSLAGRHVLIVLDNVEHLLAAAPEIGRLLDAAPDLVVLATSRAPLRIHGEHVWPVRPLDAGSAADLFVERATQAGAVAGGLDPVAVDGICGRLDRLPLAIELAAARTRLLPPDLLLDQLNTSHDLLTAGPRDAPSRQRAMWATISWSYELLTADERAMLRSVATFAGGWTMAAAAAVAEVDTATTLELHGRLMDASLITREHDRFTMLETIRVFALKHATAADHDRHAAYFEGFIATAKSGVEGADQLAWLNRLKPEWDNLRTAMRWLLDHRRMDRFADIFVFWQWIIWGHLSECRRWAEEALAVTDATLSPVSRAGVLAMHCLGLFGSDPEAAIQVAEESIRLADQVDDLALRATILLVRAQVAGWRLDTVLAVRMLEEAEAAYRELGWASSLAGVRSMRAGMIAMLGRPEEAERMLAEIETAMRGGNRPYDLAAVLNHRGHNLIALGRWEQAEGLLRESVVIWDQLGSNLNMMYALCFLAVTAAFTARPERSARLAGAASVLVDLFGPPMTAVFGEVYAKAAATATSEIGNDTYDALFQEGRGMSWDGVVALAMAE